MCRAPQRSPDLHPSNLAGIRALARLIGSMPSPSAICVLIVGGPATPNDGSRAFAAASACVSLCGCHLDVRRISGVRSSGSDEGWGLRDGRRVMS
jgi:hypothetical protein